VEGFVHIPYNDISSLQKVFVDYDDIVAVMLEPILGEGGIVIPDRGYLKTVAEICSNQNTLLVVDALAKSLGNGVPIGACMASNKAADPMSPGSHGSTFGGNPLAASAALAVIGYLKDNSVDVRVTEIGEWMLNKFRINLGDTEGVVRIDGLGLMIGIELNKSCSDLVLQGLNHNILINVTADKVVRLLPPLIINDDEANQIVTIVTELVKQFLQE